MSYFVKKIIWEYGESYGHASYPRNQEDFRAQLNELEARASLNNYPFYVDLTFKDDSYIGFIVGHKLSCFNFGIFVSDDAQDVNCRTQFDTHYDPQVANPEILLEYSFKGDYGERSMTELLPREQVIDAIYQYLETQKLPSYIRFTKQTMIDNYIDHEQG
jgi:hypothetical protein